MESREEFAVHPTPSPIANADPRYVEVHAGNPDAKLTIVVGGRGRGRRAVAAARSASSPAPFRSVSAACGPSGCIRPPSRPANLARRLARELKSASWKSQCVLSENGDEFRGERFTATVEHLGASHSRIHAGCPQTNGHVEALHKTDPR